MRQGMRPRGRIQTAGCGRWGVTSSKHALGVSTHLQATCKYCRRRARLTPTTRKVYSYRTRLAADMMCEALNNQNVPDAQYVEMKKHSEPREYDEKEDWF